MEIATFVSTLFSNDACRNYYVVDSFRKMNRTEARFINGVRGVPVHDDSDRCR